MQFEWDDCKAALNASKHKTTFEEASTVFDDDRMGSQDQIFEDENRVVAIGTSSSRRVLVVVFCERDENIRIISARPATPSERGKYEKEN
jgi:hypothetical protein